MKIKHLLIGLFAVAATVACTQEQPAETPKLEVDKEAVSLAATAAESSFNVTSNQAWAATADADWVTLDPASGEAATEAVAVKVTAEDNTAKEARTAKVTVKAGELTKTVTVTQAAGEEPEPEKPVVEEKTYILVGEAVGGWNVDENGVVLTLDGTTDGYYVAKSVAVAAKKGMHFTKNSSWEGNVKGLHGLIAPNEIGEVGGNDISLTEGGNYDVYLTEALDKFYFMSEGKLPSEAVEHVEIAVVWGVCGAYGNNNWGEGDLDVVLVQEGEWYVAKNLEFTELNFKVRGNNSWADDLKWGCAAKGQTCELNKAIAVSTCTEYKVANPGENDNPNVYIGGAGTYDIYFSPDKKEVWVMTPGYKPGDEVPGPAPADYDIDGKQWLFTWEVLYGASSVIDLGVTQPGVAIIAYDMGAIDPTLAGIIYPYITSSYTITKTDGTSGVITLSAEGQSVEITYSKATDNTVHLACPTLFGEIDCTLATSPVQIYIEQPSVSLPDGEYWIIANGKVATPLTKDYGYLQVVDAVNGKSTAANAFKFTQVEAGLYTIQDSNGKYYYQTGTYDSFNVADTDGETDEYLWEVVEYAEGQYVIQNVKVAKAIQYDTQYKSYGSYEDLRGVLPNLVLAEDPIAEPEPEPGVLAEWLFSADAMAAYADSFGGTDGVLDKTAGDGGKYVAANKAGTGKISYVQVDKTEVDVDGKAERIVGSTGHPYVIGIWSGDYWLFEATAATECPAGTKVNISYITRTSGTGHKYWRLEYLDGSEWKAAMTTEKKTVNEKEIEYNIAMNKDGKTNVEVDATVTLSSATKDVKFRMLAVGDVVKSSDESLVTKPNGGTCRIAGAEGTSPVIKVVE